MLTPYKVAGSDGIHSNVHKILLGVGSVGMLLSTLKSYWLHLLTVHSIQVAFYSYLVLVFSSISSIQNEAHQRRPFPSTTCLSISPVVSRPSSPKSPFSDHASATKAGTQSRLLLLLPHTAPKRCSPSHLHPQSSHPYQCHLFPSSPALILPCLLSLGVLIA